MPVKLERSFRADSPIGTYWLGHCTGFRVKGFRRSGTVEEVELAVDGRVDALAVRRRGFVRSRLILVPADSISTVDPWEEMVVLSRGRTNGRPKRYVPPARAVVAAGSLAQKPRRRIGRRPAAEAPPLPVAPVRPPAPPVREPEPELVEDVVWFDPPAEAVFVEAPPPVEETLVLDALPAV